MHLLSIRSKDWGQFAQFSATRVWFGLGIAAIVLCSLMFYAGLRAAEAFEVRKVESQVAEWEAELDRQRELLASTRAELRRNLDALALRIGEMNARLVRLNALGARLTQMGGLEDGEFDFGTSPALGGPEALVPGADGNQLGGVVEALNRLDLQLADRAQQLDVLEAILLGRKLADEVRPEGRPVAAGYISSGFGERSDPITGNPAFHEGIDFAGREGSEIVAVAAGVVTWASDRDGFGQTVEVNHGNGYTTRYAHNAINLVSQGDLVNRGDVIARMGDTGRATGPSLHFEVLRGMRPIDPLRFVN